ncbi:MAG TPA: Fe-S oxidoreductase [Phycisphaerae bacterium]|nr:Fe-S oxidoreductase [Phycisphaerae bacterium]
MLEQLRQTCRDLLQSGKVDVVIGYGQDDDRLPAYPVFVTRPEDADQLVWNDRCFSNLTVYLTRPEIKALGNPAVVLKGCDERALVVLAKESQIDRGRMVAIGMACDGVGNPREAKCSICDVHQPKHSDVIIGKAKNEPLGADRRYAAVEELMKNTPAERMAFWRDELSRCVRCYACRQVCPLCYCNRCLADKNQPQCIDTSATLKGNFAWHLARAFHLAARCAGCDECIRACPAGIDLRLLNLTLARSAETQFGYRSGMDTEDEPVMGAYRLQDKEDFIR